MWAKKQRQKAEAEAEAATEAGREAEAGAEAGAASSSQPYGIMTMMDSSNSSNGPSQQRRRLTKKPPASLHNYTSFNADGQGRFDGQSLHSKRSSTSLKRAPSAPHQRPWERSTHQTTTPTHSIGASNNSSPRHLPTNSISSNQPSPILATGEFLPSTFSPLHQPASRNHPSSPIVGPGETTYATAGHYTNNSGTTGLGQAGLQQAQATGIPKTRDHRLSDPHHAHAHAQGQLSSKTSEELELVGAPFDGTSILNHLEATKSYAYHNHKSFSSRRPAPPPLAHAQTTPSPNLRQSASYSADSPAAMSLAEKAQQGASSQLSGPKRYSDETKDPKPPGVLRKKSGFSGLMSTLVGSPKKPIISAPENPVHVTHVGYDSSTGQFTVCTYSFVFDILHSNFVQKFMSSAAPPLKAFVLSLKPPVMPLSAGSGTL